MRGSVANVEEGAFQESPLKPLQNRLCLIKALGLPLKIKDTEGTVVANKRPWTCFAILILPFLVFVSGWIGSFFVSPREATNVEIWLQEKGFHKWDIQSTYMIYLIFGLMPFFYIYFYRGLGLKFNKFIKTFESTYMKLNNGENRKKEVK